MKAPASINPPTEAYSLRVCLSMSGSTVPSGTIPSKYLVINARERFTKFPYPPSSSPLWLWTKFPPGKIRVFLLRAARQKKIVDGVGLVVRQQILYPDGVVLAGGYLSPLQSQVFAGYDPVRQMPPAAVSQQKGGQDDGVERDVVFSMHIVMDGILCPESAEIRAPFFGGGFAGGEIPRYVFRPDIDGLAFIPCSRNRNPPLQIPGQSSVPDIVVGKGNGVPAPIGVGIHQSLELPFQPGYGDVEMPCFPETYRLSAGGADRLQQALRLRHRAAGIALVAPGVFPALGHFPSTKRSAREEEQLSQ